MLSNPRPTAFRNAIQQRPRNEPIVASPGDVRVELVNDPVNFPDGDFDVEVRRKMLGHLADCEEFCHPKMLRVWSELSHFQRGN
jgi:hypothetical protein